MDGTICTHRQGLPQGFWGLSRGRCDMGIDHILGGGKQPEPEINGGFQRMFKGITWKHDIININDQKWISIFLDFPVPSWIVYKAVQYCTSTCCGNENCWTWLWRSQMGHEFRDLKLSLLTKDGMVEYMAWSHPHARRVFVRPICKTLTKINGINPYYFRKNKTTTSWAVTKRNPKSIEHVASHIFF